MRFEFCEGLLNGVEIGRGGWQQPQFGAGRLDGFAHSGNFVRRQIVHRDDLSRRQRRHHTLLQISDEDFAIHRRIDDERSGDAVRSQGGDKRRYLPVAVRDLGEEPLPARSTATQPGHIGRRAGFIDEDELLRIKPRLLLFPVRAGYANVGALLLGRVQAFF